MLELYLRVVLNDMVDFGAFFPADIQVILLLTEVHTINCVGLNLDAIEGPNNDLVLDRLLKHHFQFIIIAREVDIFIILEIMIVIKKSKNIN